MSDLAISLLSGSAATIVVAVVVWAIIAKISGLSSQLADTRIGLAAANATALVRSKELEDERAARKHWEEQYAAATEALSRVKARAVAAATDADAVSLAGGDPGDPGGSAVVGHPGAGVPAGDGLLEPDWGAPGPAAGSGTASSVLPADGPSPAGGQVVPSVRP